MKTTYEVANIIHDLIMRRAAEALVYSWSESFAISQIRTLPEDVKGFDWYRPIDPTDLTEEEMQCLGFGIWSNDSPMRLIPLWLYPFLADEFPSRSILGEMTTKKAELDTDNRFGCLAYGVLPKDQ